MASGSHSGHRGRLRKRVENYGMDSLEDHEFLELLLYNVIPRVNTNPIAHGLIERFGSLEGVFGASEEELRKAGLPERAAFWIANLRSFAKMYVKYYRKENAAPIEIIFKTDAYIRQECSRAFRENKDLRRRILVVSVSITGEIVHSRWLKPSGAEEDDVSEVCRIAVRNKACYVVTAHTYPESVIMPTEHDCRMTERYDRALSRVGVVLLDRYHVTPIMCSSYLKMGAFFENAEDFEHSLYYDLMKSESNK